ncbi:xanthine dehydrogenase family protein molybdopterin-binding subunit [Roseovarius spongiae]|uniref:Xanthine dehydrogenase family protein molybdopterin-binding subunit n=1 Tax=Roseovarius spongiae TaxID=2320272 RepID=A0A3A8B1U3_9RHOB|nr:xanthine dehydrogenase family protein molybdopterin-binding subunit [Roseovarius spongiae]RKF12610.1 xanthine dehydrogenase family protein molybdopterin-binding subunit [Roseovarius spongiae]
MTAHHKMDEPDRRNRLDAMAQGIVGVGMDRPDGPEKVSGRAVYAHDGQVKDMLHGVMVRATIAKGTLLGIDEEPVKALPGVRAVLHGPRFLRNPAQGAAGEAPVQGSAEIAYFGQPVALVVADTFEQARHGAQSLALRYDEAEATVAPGEAEAETPEDKQSATGDLDAAMRDAAFSVDRTYTTPPHNSAPMEPHAAIAEYRDGKFTVRASCQMVKYNLDELADSLGVDAADVHLLSPFVGGGFGSKLGISAEAVAAALAARELDRPVAVALSRPQVFEATMRRSETRQRFRLAADADGRLTGVGHEVLVSNLPGETFSEPATQATPFLYRGENRVIGHRIARVNRTCAGSVRAPGEAVGVTALEIAMDELAQAAGVDPVELRRRNIPEEDPSRGVPFSSHMLEAALDDGAERFGWSDRPKGGTRNGEWLIGCGMASSSRVNLLNDSAARVTMNRDGTALVETDMTDIGTGTYAILTQVAAEMLGLPPDRVETRLGDSDLPKGAGSGGSQGASSSASSVFLACERLRCEIAERAGCAEEALTLKDGHAISDNRQQPLAELLQEPLSAEGVIHPGDAESRVRQASFGAFFVEVGVSAVTGEARVRRMHGSFAAGRILNAKTARSQCLGGMTFGIGMALTEELMHDPRDGHIVNRDLAEYHVPVNADVPQLTVNLLEERDPWTNPVQAKGIGELAICGAGASIVNAIHDACGVRVRDLPATLDKILPGLPERAGREG